MYVSRSVSTWENTVSVPLIVAATSTLITWFKKHISCTVFDVLIFSKTHISDITSTAQWIHLETSRLAEIGRQCKTKSYKLLLIRLGLGLDLVCFGLGLGGPDSTRIQAESTTKKDRKSYFKPFNCEKTIHNVFSFAHTSKAHSQKIWFYGDFKPLKCKTTCFVFGAAGMCNYIGSLQLLK